MGLLFNYPQNITNFIDFLNYVNYLTDGFLGTGILIIIFFVSFLSTKSYTYERAFGFASFLTFVSALLLRFMELINNSVLSIFVIILVISIVLLWKERSSEGY